MIRRIKAFSRARTFWAAYKKNRLSVVGLAIIIFLVLIAVFAPNIAPFWPYDVSFDILLPPGYHGHILGTTDVGADVFSQLIWGSRVSLAYGFFAAGISLTIGLSLGSIAGYYGGFIDEILSRFFELVMMIPTFFLLIVVISLFGTNMFLAILIIGFKSWPGNARIARTQVISIKQRGFVQAAIGLGASNFRVLFGHIIPNGLHPVLANATLQVGGAILMEASLSFLGLGDPNQISWGQILYRGQFVYSQAWWMGVFPGIMISAAALAFNVVGDGINAVLKPKAG